MSTSPTTSAQSVHTQVRGRERIDWVDCSKGLCIVLVVFGHVVGGLEAARIVPGNSPLLVARTWVYLFHMPAFFFLSGIFAGRSSKRPLPEFAKTRVATLVYPYILWTGIILLSQVAMARFANNPPDFARALKFYYEPYGYGLWFLYALLLISWVHYFLSRSVASASLIFIAAALHVCSLLNCFGFWPILNRSAELFLYYALGSTLADRLFSSFKEKSMVRNAAIGLLLFGIMTLIGTFNLPWLGAIPALCGTAGLIYVANGIACTNTGQFFVVLGLYSLEIFLGHALFSTASRAVLGKLGVHAPPTFVLAGVIVGVGASVILGMACRKFHFSYLFRWPMRKVAAATN